VLFLDGDEVPEGARVREWWIAIRHRIQADIAVKLANHWSFVHRQLVSEEPEDSVLLVPVAGLVAFPAALCHPRERDGIWMTLVSHGYQLVRSVRDVHAHVMFRHYSWVREDREALKAKCRAWGHHAERDWAALIDAVFDDIRDRGTYPTHDFVHGRRLRWLLESPPPFPVAASPGTRRFVDCASTTQVQERACT
jgi:hypothetical protein